MQLSVLTKNYMESIRIHNSDSRVLQRLSKKKKKCLHRLQKKEIKIPENLS